MEAFINQSSAVEFKRSIDSEIGNIILSYMDKNNISILSLSKKYKIDYSSLHKALNGKISMSKKIIRAFTKEVSKKIMLTINIKLVG